MTAWIGRRPARSSSTWEPFGPARRRDARVESSCPCVAVAPAAFEVAPGGSVALAVARDLADEPDFRGGLAVEVVGRAADGRALGIARVAATVLE